MAVPRKPDPSQGIFETMLVVRGVPVAPKAHLSRLAASVEAVYRAVLPERTLRLVAEHAEGLELGRLRLTFVPIGKMEVEFGEIDRSLHFPERPISLRTQAIDGGLGCHKWADRTAIPPNPSGGATLIVDGDQALEADRANVFAVRRGTVFTSPLDGRILPGVTRATTIELARALNVEMVERPLALSDLCESEEVFLTNSIRGIESVGSIDGSLLPAAKPLTHTLTGALRTQWGLAKREPAPASAAGPPPRQRAR